jgi:hypothetical protein
LITLYFGWTNSKWVILRVLHPALEKMKAQQIKPS